MGVIANTFMPHIVFCYGVDNDTARPTDEIDYIGLAINDMGSHILVQPVFYNHDALIVPKEFIL